MRLGRDLNRPFEKDGHEYGNYEKYSANKATVEVEDGNDDDGESKFFKNYMNMIKTLNTKEGDGERTASRENLRETIENYKI